MILSDSAILEAIGKRHIIIEPFKYECLGPNSYDVHLGATLAVYRLNHHGVGELDCAKEPRVEYFNIPESGYILDPQLLYLGSTVEYTETHNHVPYLDGKSSIGRLGISVHTTAGRGDVGFCNHWTLEITVKHSVKVYPGMAIGQLTYHTVEGRINRPYNTRGKYNERDSRPQPSRMWKNFRSET